MPPYLPNHLLIKHSVFDYLCYVISKNQGVKLQLRNPYKTIFRCTPSTTSHSPEKTVQNAFS